jgi:predicted acylesterase/phospholipase RssA
MADSRPLRALLRKHIDRAFLNAIADEYAKGRELWIATTNLDSRVRYIWNMTRIAVSQDPRALDLFHSLIIASAAIPGAFPPVMIDVEVDGRRYQEMHVDGGAMAQVFVYPIGWTSRHWPPSTTLNGPEHSTSSATVAWIPTKLSPCAVSLFIE